MTDKEKILYEIEHLKWKVTEDDAYANGWQQALRQLEITIHSLQENSVSEELEEACANSVSQEPRVSYFTNGQATIGAYSEESLENQFISGANWQKEQMMKNGLDAMAEFMHECHDVEYFDVRLNDYVSGNMIPLSDGEKVKLIIVKE